MTTAPDLREELFTAQEWYADLAAGVEDDQRGLPTPCPDFDVRGLMVHTRTVLEKIIGFAEIHRDPFNREDYTDEVAQAYAKRHVDGRSPSELREDARTLTNTARDAWTDDVLDTEIHLGWGPKATGREVLGIYLMEVLAHGWDLAVATGQSAEAPRGVAETALEAAQTALPAEPRGMTANGIPFEPVVESAPEDGPTERLAHWTGRSRPERTD